MKLKPNPKLKSKLISAILGYRVIRNSELYRSDPKGTRITNKNNILKNSIRYHNLWDKEEVHLVLEDV